MQATEKRIKITICLSGEYLALLDRARTAADLRKCRNWFRPENIIDNTVELTLNPNGIDLQYNTAQGIEQASCLYDGVLAVTEMKDGVLLRLSHKRLLFLPVSQDPRENEILMDAVVFLEEKCNYIFRESRLHLHGVSVAKRWHFRTRPKQGHYIGNHSTKIILTALICLLTFMGAIFVLQPIQNRKTDKQDAIVLSATYDSYQEVSGRGGGLNYVDLQFADAQEQTIDGCCIGSDLLEKLEQLAPGTQIQLWIHPDSNDILQIEVEGEIILDYDYAQKQLWTESLFFAGMGLFIFALDVWLIVYVIRKKY